MIAVVDYEIGNLRSAQKALEHLGAAAVLTGDAEEIRGADAVVLPGVGAFGACMGALRDSGLDTAVEEVVDAGTPFLGVCVGMQMLFDGSEEDPDIAGLGLVKGMVRRLPDELVLPHMGWNTLAVRNGARLFEGTPQPLWVYFVHSYAADPADPAVVSATTEYGGEIVAAVEQDNVWATQFHPEKSGDAGLAVLKNFVHASGAG